MLFDDLSGRSTSEVFFQVPSYLVRGGGAAVSRRRALLVRIQNPTAAVYHSSSNVVSRMANPAVVVFFWSSAARWTVDARRKLSPVPVVALHSAISRYVLFSKWEQPTSVHCSAPHSTLWSYAINWVVTVGLLDDHVHPILPSILYLRRPVLS